MYFEPLSLTLNTAPCNPFPYGATLTVYVVEEGKIVACIEQRSSPLSLQHEGGKYGKTNLSKTTADKKVG